MKTKKIDIYTKRRFKPRDADSIVWEYAGTTEQSTTCKDAKRKFCARYGLSEDQVKARFKR